VQVQVQKSEVVLLHEQSIGRATCWEGELEGELEGHCKAGQVPDRAVEVEMKTKSTAGSSNPIAWDLGARII
jgi:hypothetical protein